MAHLRVTPLSCFSFFLEQVDILFQAETQSCGDLGTSWQQYPSQGGIVGPEKAVKTDDTLMNQSS